jgi:hypothetical protein
MTLALPGEAMIDADRLKLLFGPYRTPRVRLGRVLTCEARGADVIVVGYSDAPIPWPVCKVSRWLQYKKGCGNSFW